MEDDTFPYVLERCSAHHFVKLLLAVLRGNNKKAAVEVLQIAKLGHGVLYVCRVFHLEEAVRHLALVKPDDVYCSCPVCKAGVLEIGNVDG